MDIGFITTPTETPDAMVLDLGALKNHQVQNHHPQAANDPMQSPSVSSSLPVPSTGSNIYSPPNPSISVNNRTKLAPSNADLPIDTLDLDPSYLEHPFSSVSLPADQACLPYIYRPSISRTVCQLLSIEGQFESYPEPADNSYVHIIHAMQAMIYFPPTLDIYNYRSAADPSRMEYWTGGATINGVSLGRGVYPSNYLMKRGGVTRSDSLYLVEKLKRGFTVNNAWS
jgi:hypothetical protein